MKGWDVFLNGKWIDKVFYDTDCQQDYVRRGLIQHDGYHPNIVVTAEPKRREK